MTAPDAQRGGAGFTRRSGIGEQPSHVVAHGDPASAFALDRVAGALAWSVDQLAQFIPQCEWVAHKGSEYEYPQPATAQHVLYRHWYRLPERPHAGRTEAIALPTDGPRVSVVVPVFRTEPWLLRECVESVLAQTYRSWELCLCNDGSDSEEISALLAKFVADDARIKVSSHDRNRGIAAATNTAVAMTSSQWVGLLDHDDVLMPEALGEFALVISSCDDADVIYSDDDMLDEDGHIDRPHFKPDWAPDLLLSYPYLGHLTMYRKSLLEAIGGFRSEFDGSQDYDVMLRATERARRVVHIPEVLYHWRAHVGSAAHSADAKPWAHAASRRVVEATLARRGIDGWVDGGPFLGAYHVRRRLRRHPSVRLVIPFRDQAALTATCLASLSVDPGYDNFEIVMVDNGSIEPETRVMCSRWRESGITVLSYPQSFNWSAINNLAARDGDSELLLFLNNDVEATSPGWLAALVEHAIRPEVGAVGARLLFEDGAVQHAGVVLGVGGAGTHLFRGLPAGRPGYFRWESMVRPYSAVTGACLMTRRDVFLEVGGFDEELVVAYNDLDYCLRVVDAGLRIIYTPHAELIHHEAVSRGMSGSSRDFRRFFEKWGRQRLLHDPFYNPNLSLRSVACSLRLPEDWQWWDRHTRRWLQMGMRSGGSEADGRRPDAPVTV
jgi:O-antigen biosynthesis protein